MHSTLPRDMARISRKAAMCEFHRDGRHGAPEALNPVMPVLVSLLAPQVVVPVLAARGRIGADGLHVTGGISAIHTSCQAGGITRALIRASVRGSLTVVASAPR